MQPTTHVPQLTSLSPPRIFDVLDLDRPDLAAVRSAHEAGDDATALEELRAHYRDRFPFEPCDDLTPETRERAEQVVNHTFQWGPYDPVDYGPEVRWDWDAAKDIEWVAAVYRFFWATPLFAAYRATRDDRYAAAFVELASDWIDKHPLEEHGRPHYVYDSWHGFAWLDIQTGIRVRHLAQVVPILVHSGAFTPAFLAKVLASVHDHQVKTWRLPTRDVHNKGIIEQHGFIEAAATFPEFRDARAWLEHGMREAHIAFSAQVTPEGVQREWCGGYHHMVASEARQILERLEGAGLRVPGDFRELVRAMHFHVFAIATPDLSFPMFGDTARKSGDPARREDLHLYGALKEVAGWLDDPGIAAVADLDEARLPEQMSYVYEYSGLAALRSGWRPADTYLALHCSQPAITCHDSPDNGTFELWSHGRWLMSDSGYYTYGRDPDGRAWHRQTWVHNTLTVNRRDTWINGRIVLWDSAPDGETLVCENDSYPAFLHRRTVWFAGRRFFVFLDEAIGGTPGDIEVFFWFAPGEVLVDAERASARTRYDDANVLVQSHAAPGLETGSVDGWHAPSYGVREPRKGVAFKHAGRAPVSFVTAVVPFGGADAPAVVFEDVSEVLAGRPRTGIRVSCDGQGWRLGRDLARREAWCCPD